MSPLRAMAVGLSDAALEAAASRGLVRRAAADVAVGKVQIQSEDDKSARLLVDGEQVSVGIGGLAKSDCSCPAPAICRHRLAAMIHLRESGETKPDAAADWNAIFNSLTPAAIARFAGKAGWKDVLARDPQAGSPSVADRGDTFIVSFRDWGLSVTFLSEGGLDAAITKAPAKTRKTLVAAAALEARRTFGLPLPQPEENSIPGAAAAARANVEVLAEIEGFLERCYATALSVTPIAFENEARRLSLAGRVEAWPKLASLLRQVATGLGLLRRRDAGADSEELLARIAEAYALCSALRTTDKSLRARLGGQVRQDYAAIGDIELIGLGARLRHSSRPPE